MSFGFLCEESWKVPESASIFSADIRRSDEKMKLLSKYDRWCRDRVCGLLKRPGLRGRNSSG